VNPYYLIKAAAGFKKSFFNIFKALFGLLNRAIGY